MPLLARAFPIVLSVTFVLALTLFAPAARAQSGDAAFAQALHTAASDNPVLLEFYAGRGYQPIWVGSSSANRSRRSAYIKALARAGDHGLPAGRYGGAQLQEAAKSARSAAELGQLEAQFSASFLQYSRDVQSGILTPSRVDSGIKRRAPVRDGGQQLVAFSKSSARGYLNALPPATQEYERLMKEKLELEKAIGRGGWGAPVQAKSLQPGQAGGQVTALRARLAALGYLSRGAGQAYDAKIQAAVAAFQADHGLSPDGVAGPSTIAELNRSPQERLQQVLVAMERERWTNLPLGRRHVRVNLPDFSAQIIDNGKVVFESRTVIGEVKRDQQSPEFSDVMEFLVVNPSWNVPHSITTKEYLPLLKENRNAVSHLQLIDANGNRVSRGAVNFTNYSAANFPYRLKEPPSQGNALGLVKFMFPNRYNIYLHDTPSKSLFSREVRAYSHGCIRLGDPFGFADTILKPQTGNPRAFMQAQLATGRETVVDLRQPVPVHLVYRTAFTKPRGGMEYRRDIYGRDAKVFAALAQAGVTLRAVGG